MDATLRKTLHACWMLGIAAALGLSTGVARAQDDAAVPAAAPVVDAAPAAEMPAAPEAEPAVVVPAVIEPVVAGEQPPPPAPVASEPEVEPDVGTASLGTTPTGPDGIANINLSLDNKPISDAVKLVSKVAGVSIIWVATNTTQVVSADVTDRPWKPTLQSLLDPCGLQLTERPVESGIYVVVPKTPGEREPWITESFALSYLKSGEAAELLKSLLGIAVDDKTKPAAQSKGGRATRSRAPSASADVPDAKEEVSVAFREDGRVVSYPAGNAVIVSTTALKMEEVRAVLKMIDQPRPQVYIEAKIVEVSGDAQKAIGIDWSMLAAYSAGIGGGVTTEGELGPYTRAKTKTEIRERGGANFQAGESSSARDGRGNKTYASTDPTGATASPIDGIGGGAESGTANPYVSSIAATPGAVSVEGWNSAHGIWRSVTDVQTAVFSADALQIALSALQSSDDTSVISNPKIIVANEERAIIDMSRKEPYVVVSLETEGSGDEKTFTYSTEMDVVPGNNENLPYIEQAFFTYGIKVEVTPRVNNASNITVTIQPTISDLDAYYTPGDGLTRYPVINSKRVRTVFSLGDGKTAVIGGLTTTRDAEKVSKIPLLGDIPWIGKYLFSHTYTEKVQTETIIFVTVGIIEPGSPEHVSVPEGAKLVQKHVTPEGRLISAEKAKAEQAEKLRAMERAEVMAPLGEEEAAAEQPAP